MFDGLPHSTILPKKGFRTALVVTFLGVSLRDVKIKLP